MFHGERPMILKHKCAEHEPQSHVREGNSGQQSAYPSCVVCFWSTDVVQASYRDEGHMRYQDNQTGCAPTRAASRAAALLILPKDAYSGVCTGVYGKIEIATKYVTYLNRRNLSVQRRRPSTSCPGLPLSHSPTLSLSPKSCVFLSWQ
jgi:hypothetical protein